MTMKTQLETLCFEEDLLMDGRYGDSGTTFGWAGAKFMIFSPYLATTLYVLKPPYSHFHLQQTMNLDESRLSEVSTFITAQCP